MNDFTAHCLASDPTNEGTGICGAELPCSAHPPTEPGIYRGLSADGYHRGPGISKSGLDAIARSPAHYRWARENPRPQSAEQRLGSALHCMLLEPDSFLTRYIPAPNVDKRTKAGKEIWARLAESNRIILSEDDWDTVADMADAVRSHPVASTLLEEGIAEQSVYWREGDLLAKCRPDWTDTRHDLLVDLKSSRDAGYSAFSKSCAQYRYHVQAAFYLDGCRAKGIAADDKVFIAVENSAPYCVACYTLPPRAIEIGRALYRRDLETYAQCVASGEWPGYPQEVRELSWPKWAEFADVS